MFRHMKYVYEVYREGSFSKAAAKLYISQPALSATVRKVEKEYIRTAEKIREMEEEFAGYVSSLNELSAGKLTVGDTYLFSAFVFPEILKTFREPDLLMDKYPLDSELYERRYVKKGHLLLAVPAGFSSNGPARSWSLSLNDIRNNVHMKPETYGVSLGLFEDEPFVLLRTHNDTRKRVEEICRRTGITLQVAWKLDQMLTTYHLTERRMGISFISDTALQYVPAGADVYYYKIDDPDAERNVYFYYRKNRYFTKSMAEFMKLAVTKMKQD